MKTQTQHSTPIDDGAISDLMASARYAMLQAREAFRKSLAAAVAVGHEVRRGRIGADDFEDGAIEARVYSRVAERYFDHASFSDSEWEVVEELYLSATCDRMRLLDPDARPCTALWRLKQRLRANPLANLAAIHLRDGRSMS